MKSRRELLRMLGAATMTASLSLPETARAFVRSDSNYSGIHLGAQTNAWSIDPKNLDSLLAVLEQIKNVGYAGFETGFFNLMSQFESPDEARRRISATGLKFFGIHIAIPFEKDDPGTKLPPASLYEKAAHGGRALGAERIIFSGAPSTTVDELQRKIEALDIAGRFAKSVGLGFAYHNHWWEFESKVGEIEALYTKTDPSIVSFLLDAGHAYRGGADVPLFLRQYSHRIAGLHLRDYKDGKLVPLGEGTFPLTQVAATLKQLGWKGWVLNEEEREDSTKGGLSYIEPAFKALRGAFSS